MAGSTRVFTKTLTNNDTLTVNAADNVLKLSVSCTAGSILFSGSAAYNDVASEAITLDAGQGVTLEAMPFNPLDGLTITAPTVSDSCDVILSYQ